MLFPSEEREVEEINQRNFKFLATLTKKTSELLFKMAKIKKNPFLCS